MQPSFNCVANIGDATPLCHGGAFVMIDARGVYCPELLILEPVAEDFGHGDPTSWKLYSVLCERLIAIKDEFNNIIAFSDNRFHSDSPAWFATAEALEGMAHFTGASLKDIAERALSSDPVEIASFYLDAFNYHASDNFGESQTLTRKEAKQLCAAMKEQEKALKGAHDGYGWHRY